MRLKLMITKAIEKLAAMNTTMKFRLMDLPNELIAHVIGYIHDVATLRHLSRTCRQIQDHAEPILYRHIVLRSGESAKTLIKAFQARPERASALHVLDVPCSSNSRHDTTAIDIVVTKAKSLKEMMIESPSCNASEFEAMEDWMPMTEDLFRPFHAAISQRDLPARPLQGLTKLTLHLNGPESPYWTLDDRSLPIFLHRTIQELKVSCMNVPSTLFTTIIDKRRVATPLKHLILEECNINHRGLLGLLSLPRALETLYLGENCHNFRHFSASTGLEYNRLFKNNPAATTRALQQHKRSLKSLTYATAVDYHVPFFTSVASSYDFIDEGGFADFHALESITLVGECANFERAVLTSTPPPSLKDLTFEAENPLLDLHRQHSAGNTNDDDDATLNLTPFLRAPSASVPPSLKTLTLLYEYSNPSDSILSLSRRSAIEAAAKAALEKHGIRMNVTFRERGHYFPPLLHSEPQPKEGVIYNGAVGMFAEDMDETFVNPYMSSSRGFALGRR